MRIQINKLLGQDTYIFNIDKEKELDALADAGFLASMPSKCDCCQSIDVNLASNKATSEKGTFTFVYVRCNKCGAKAQLGQYKTGGFFWKKFEQYHPEENTVEEV